MNKRQQRIFQNCLNKIIKECNNLEYMVENDKQMKEVLRIAHSVGQIEFTLNK